MEIDALQFMGGILHLFKISSQSASMWNKIQEKGNKINIQYTDLLELKSSGRYILQ